jgi:uncharacterized protein YkwD
MRWIGWVWLACLGLVLACSPRAHKGAAVAGVSELAWADAYSTQATQGGLLGDASDAELSGALDEGCQQAQLLADGRLSQLAEALAHELAGQARTPDAALVSFHARRLGLSEPTPQLWIGNGSNAAAVVPALRAALPAAANGGATHCGAAAVRGGYGVLVVASFVRRALALERPIPRELAAGAPLVLAGRLAPGYGQATLATTDPEGKVARVELTAAPVIEHQVRLGAPGIHTLELLATGPEGVTVVALFPVAVGVPFDRAPPRPPSGEVERDASAVERRLLALIAEERDKRGLPPLRLHPELSNVALAHSTDMHEHHFVAHTSKQTGEAKDRVQRAGMRTTLLLENIGRGYGADEIHQGLMESPGHRANILHPDVRALGMGVVAEVEGERSAFLATQLFATFAQPVNWERAQADLFQAIAASRKQHKRGATTLDGALSRAAQAAADGYVQRPSGSEQALLDHAMRGVRGLPAGATALTAALVKAEDLAQVAESPELLDPRLAALGLGVAPLPEGSSHALAVVLLLALRQ